MNPNDLANWKCICGRGASIQHQVNGYCDYKRGYAQAIEDAVNLIRDFSTTGKGRYKIGFMDAIEVLEVKVKAFLSKEGAK